MRFNLEIDCDNAAFGETENECAREVERILRTLSPYWTTGGAGIRDTNGNSVGTFYFTND